MSLLTDIRELLKLIAYNQKVARWFIIIVVLIGVGGFFYFKYKPKAESDCEFVKKQNKELLAFILDARRQVKELAQPTSYIQRSGEFIFASFDTIPKTKQQKAVVLLSKFDSLLLKVKQDSIERSRKKQ